MKTRRALALVLALCMVIGLAACGTPANNGGSNTTPGNNNNVEPAPGKDDSKFFGPIYDEWSDMTDEQLYEKAKEELKDGGAINIYATSSKMLKNKETFEAAFPGLTVEIMDLDNDEVLQKCVQEARANNVLGDVLQVKDVNGDVFYQYYEEGIIAPFYPKDICAHINKDLLKYGYPLYASQSFW